MAGNKFLQIPQVQSDVTVQNVTTVGERETLLQAPPVQNSSQECQVVILGDSNRFMNAPSISDITYSEGNPVQACSIDYGVYGNGSIEKDPVFKASPAGLITMADIARWNATSAPGIVGPIVSVDDNIVLFSGITGNIVKDSGYKLSDFSLTSHDHTGVYQPIGTYSTDIHSNISALNLVSGTNTGDNAVNSLYSGLVSFPGFGTNHITAAYGDHTHTGVYQPVGTYSTDIHSNISALDAVSGINTGDQDLSGYALTSHNHTGVYAPALGSDDNYVTDVEKAALHAHANLAALANVSGTNTGDNATNTTSNSYADGKVSDSITNGVLTIAPSQNAVFDALALKENAGVAASLDITVLSDAKAYADTLVVGLWDDRGSFDASVNTYPTTGGSGIAGAILKGDIWTLSVIATSGPLLGYTMGTTIRALVDSPAQVNGNWALSGTGLGYSPENVANKVTSISGASTDVQYPTAKLLYDQLALKVPTSRTLTINGTALDLSANRSWSVGTVTSVAALTLTTTGTDLTSSVATGTTTPIITLNVPTASATNRGVLSTADWANFNTAYADRNKWDGGATGLTAATGRTSLGATTVGSNLFTLTNPSAITFLRVNADNTVSALDATAFRTAIGAGTSSAVGTVTSVAALTLGTSGTDISSSVATSTTTPVITLNIPTASGSNRGALSSTDWTTFNNKVSNATHTGDATGATALTVVALNGTNLAGLATGLLKNTTGTGVPTIVTDNSSNWNTAFGWGNHTGLYAPTSGSANYIQNQSVSAQTASLWITGAVISNSTIQATTVKLTNLTDGYLPYHISDALGLTNSPVWTDGTKVGINNTTPVSLLDIKGSVSYEAPTLSAEFLSGAGWTSTGWTGSWATGWVHTAGNTSVLSYPTAAVITTKYEIAYTVTGRTIGSFTIAFGGQTISSQSDSDTWGPTTSSTANLTITPTSDFDGTIVISIKSITAVRSALVSYTSSTGVVLRELRIDLANPTNQFDGYGSGRYNTSGVNNTGYGYLSLSQVTSGYSNTGIGREALRDLTTGSYNMALGNLSGTQITTGTRNVGVGTGSIYTLTTGSYNVGIGYNAIRNGITMFGNVGIGYYSLSEVTNNYNTGIGYYALGAIANVTHNVGIGYQAGRFITDGVTANTTGTTSVFLGADARPAANGETNQIVVGYNTIGNGTNTVTIGNSSILRTYLRGVNLAAGTATAGTAPLKLTSGTVLGTTEAGAIEFDGTHLYFTATNAGSRFQLDQQSSGANALGTYIVQAATNAPANAQVLALLGTGLVKNTTTTGVLSIASAGTDYIAPNVAITAATKTKITYDIRGLVTAGADATTADIAASTNKNYVTDAQLTVIGNTSGTNTGDSAGHTVLVPYTGATGAVTLGTYGLTAASTILTKADSGAATDLLINPTAKTSGYFIDTQINGATKFRVAYNGVVSLSDLTPATYQNLLIYESGNVRAGLGVAPAETRVFAPQGTSLTLGHISTADGSTFDCKLSILTGGNIGIGAANITPTAKLHLPAGSTAASSAPLKFNTGALMTTAEAGAIEFLTDAYYGTITTGAARKQFAFTDYVDLRVLANGAITGATKTKITYDTKGLVTAGADATTADIADSSNKRYVTDAQLVVIGNTSGTNSGDNAINSLYSGLAASKQDTLVSGTNIKTINSTSLLGSGDIVISGAGVPYTGATTNLNLGAYGLYATTIGVNTTSPADLLTIKTTSSEETATLSGTELVNGTGWTTTGWTGSYPSYTHSTGNVTPLYRTVTLATFSVYQVSWTMTGRTAGGVTIGLNGQTAKGISAVYSVSGAVSFKTGATTTGDLIFTPGTTFDGTLSDISVQLVSASSKAALSVYDSGNSNVFQLRTSVLANNNLYLGSQVGKYTTTGVNNLGIGYNALFYNTTGNYNVAIGASSMLNNTAGEYNTAVGGASLNKNTTGYFNVAFGNSALYVNTEGAYNVGLGSRSLFANITGATNIAIGGYLALGGNTTGNYNIGMGSNTLNGNSTGSYNIAIGTGSLYSITTSNNLAIGYNSGRYIADGSTASTTTANSVYVGISTKASVDGATNEAVLGYNAIGFGSNSISLGNSSVTKLAIGASEVFYQAITSGSIGSATKVLTSNGPSSAPTWEVAGGGSGLSFAQVYALTTLNL